MKTIALAGGGTAGHVMPHVSLMPELKKHFDKIIYFSCGKQIELDLIKPCKVSVYTISPPAFYRSISPKNLSIPFKMHKAINACATILKNENVTVVFSKGGYCALPVCLAAKKLGIPYVCHESDLSLGLANKLTYKNSDGLLTVFKQTAEKYNGIYVGPPMRESLTMYNKYAARKKLGISTAKPILLITGGSQGSQTINRAVANNLTELLKHFCILHLYGKGNKPAYKSINDYYPMPFGDMNLCIPACDICLSRGGSNTLFELLYCKKPALIVPLKKASRGDQIKNAAYFAKQKAVAVCDELYLNDNIVTLLTNLYSNSADYKKAIEALNIKNGTQNTAKYLMRF